MQNKLIEGIVSAIYSHFENGETDKYKYYRNNVEQNLVRPSFFPIAVAPSVRALNPPRYRYTIPCVIHYFPTNLGDKSEIYDVGDELMKCLEYVHIGDRLVRGVNMSYEIEDDVLLFNVVYDFIWANTIEDEETMETEEWNGDAK